MRDYCQHGEPMDEHCPQCNTKAAANISATAPVPAGGTPEGLAREKVEMAESEVKPSREEGAGRAVQEGPSALRLHDGLDVERANVLRRRINIGAESPEGRRELHALVDDALAEARTPVDSERLRYILWISHGHDGLYGDDGEMQCHQCGVDWDYLRGPLPRLIERAYSGIAMANLRAASPLNEVER